MAAVLLLSLGPLLAGDLYPAEQVGPVLKAARSWLGTPYKYGGDSRRGIDCSGLVWQSFRKLDPQIPRSSRSIAAYKHGREVRRIAQLGPGDLVFFKSRSRQINHVGLVTSVQDGKVLFIHSTSRGVVEDRLAKNWQRDFVYGKQVFARSRQKAVTAVARKTDVPAGGVPGVFPRVSQRPLTRGELLSFQKADLQLMRHEAFARYGYRFSDKDLQRYFDKQDWYKRIANKSSDGGQIFRERMTELERRNVRLIREVEKRL